MGDFPWSAFSGLMGPDVTWPKGQAPVADDIVLFGGTFDPVHHGHLIVARALAEARGFDSVTFVPASAAPHKQPAGASAEHRLAMLRLATAGDDLFDICRVELDRSGPSYTVETLAALREARGRGAAMHWVIGTDMLADLPSWHRAEEVMKTANILVAARSPWQDRLEGIFEQLGGSFPEEQVRRLREGLVATPQIDISSSDIRRRLAEGRSIRFLVPEAVADYIHRHGLYRQDRL